MYEELLICGIELLFQLVFALAQIGDIGYYSCVLLFCLEELAFSFLKLLLYLFDLRIT